MGIVDGPAMSLRASGNVGALCYSTWRGQQVARAKSTLICGMTTPQQKAQDAVGEASVKWSGLLLADQRALWEQYAKSQTLINRLGLHWVPSGYQIYMKRSVQALLIGGAVQTLPPTNIRAIKVLSVVIAAKAAVGEVKIEMTFGTVPYGADVVQVFRAGPFVGGGRRAIAPEFLEVQQILTPFTWDDTGLTSGQYYWYKVRWGVLEGVVSSYWWGQVLVS